MVHWFYKTLRLLALIGLCAGCSIINPKDKKPPLVIPQQWNIKHASLKSGNNLPYTAWWQQFHDPMLNQLIETGLTVNNTVLQAQGNLEMAQGELRSIQLSWLPSIDWFAGFSQNPALGIPGGFYGMWPGYFGINAFMTLAQQKSAHIAIEAQGYALQSTKLVLIGQIANGYYAYIAEQEQLRLFKHYQRDLTELLAIQNDNYKGGISSLIPAISLQEAIAKNASKQRTIEDNIAKSQNALRYLLNENPGSLPQGAAFGRIKTNYKTFGALPATVLANRPDVAFAEAKYRLAVQQVGIMRSSLLPIIQLDDFIGRVKLRSADFPHGKSVNAVDAYGKWSIDPAVFGQISALQGTKKAAYFAYVDTVRKALRDVANAMITHKTANERYQDIAGLFQAAQEKLGLDKRLYQQGVIPYASLLESTFALDGIALELNEARFIQMASMVNLYQELGGGFKVIPSEAKR